MECEVWLVKSFYKITKVERGHLKSNYGYLESSLEISAFHYIVQESKQMTTQWRFVFGGILSTVLGDGRIIQQTKVIISQPTIKTQQLASHRSSTNHLSSFVS